MSGKWVESIEIEIAASEKTFDIAFYEAVEQARRGAVEGLILDVVEFDSARCKVRFEHHEYAFVFKAIYNQE
jgi:hypothetical protein